VNRQPLIALLAVLGKHRDHLSHTYHLPGQINLFDLADREMYERLLRGGIEGGLLAGLGEPKAWGLAWSRPRGATTPSPPADESFCKSLPHKVQERWG